MTYESILKEVGGWGRYQKCLCFLLTLSAVPNGYFTMIMVFTSKTPEHRCRILEIDGPADNHTMPVNYNAVGVRDYIPWDIEHDRYERCVRYASTANASEESVEKCDIGLVYDVRPGEETAVTEFDLVCDRAGIKPQITSIYMSGILVGSIISGIISDRFGRWGVIIFGTFFQFVFMALNAICIGPEMYAALMFLAGGCSLINFVAAVVLGAEIIDIEHRAFVETAIMIGFAIGYMILPLFAYFILDWKMLMLSAGLAGIVFIPYWWLIPESPRWLILMKKFEKAKILLTKIAKFNGRRIDIEQLLSTENLELIDREDSEDRKTEAETGKKCFTYDRIPYLNLFTKPGMLTRTLCMCCSWWIISMTYYTMNLNTGNMGKSDILNCFVSGAVEIPAYASVYLFLRNKGRRWLLIAYMFLAALLCGITPLLDKWNETAAVASAMCGKFFVTSAFSLVYLYTTELFPTEARNQALGISSVCARVGGTVAPYIVYMGEKISDDLPYIISATLVCLTGMVDCLLPETQGTPLPDTFEEARKTKRRPCCVTCCKKRPSSEEFENDAL